MARPGDPVGGVRLGMAIGFDKHPRGAFNAEPAAFGLGDWYGEIGHDGHDAVLRA